MTTKSKDAERTKYVERVYSALLALPYVNREQVTRVNLSAYQMARLIHEGMASARGITTDGWTVFGWLATAVGVTDKPPA